MGSFWRESRGKAGFLILVPQVRVLPGAPTQKGQKLKNSELLAFFSAYHSNSAG